jgi:transposase
MRKISEVLRLSASGLGIRDIATSVGASKTTVADYLARARGCGLGWPLPEHLDEAAIEARLFPPNSAALAAARPVPDWRQVYKELKRRDHHVTLKLLWLEWKNDHPSGWGYTQFCLHYQEWLSTKDVVMRLSYPAGERMFVDFSGDTMEIVEAKTGEIAKAEIFVTVLGCSGLLYVEATPSQDLPSWLRAHVHAFSYYGGVVEVTVPDNLKAGVTKACFYDPEVNPSYLELALHYNTVVLPTRTARPRDKAAVEAGVLSVEHWVLAPLRNRRFFSLAELNEAISAGLEWLNDREFRGEVTSRRELFNELEREALRPLPARPYEFAAWKKVTANIDYHVEGPDRRFYSVPYRLVRQRLDLRATADTVEVFKAGIRVASHAREYGRRRYITDPEHMPASHRAHLEWSPSRLVAWARTVGPETGELAERLLRSKPHPEHAYRACLGLMSLARRYSNERVNAACARALHCGAISYSSVKSILAENLDRQPLTEQVALPAPSTHENLRGSAYYAESTEEAEA